MEIQKAFDLVKAAYPALKAQRDLQAFGGLNVIPHRKKSLKQFLLFAIGGQNNLIPDSLRGFDPVILRDPLIKNLREHGDRAPMDRLPKKLP